MKHILFVLLIIVTFGCQQEKNRTLLFVGSFTDKTPGKGIKIYDFNSETAEVGLLCEVDGLINPSFLRLSPHGKFLYSVLESQMESNGKVAAFSIDSAGGQISLLNVQDCGGRNPVHIEIDKGGRNLIISNYTDPGISVFNINIDGSLNEYTQSISFLGSSIIKGRQEGAHIHASYFSPDENYLFSQDLGSDRIHKIKVDENEDGIISLRNDGHIAAIPGSGPRHFTFHPFGKYAYGIAELSGKVTAYEYTGDDLEFIEDYPTYSKIQTMYRAADIHISPDGRFLYVSNRGPDEDTIAIFSIGQHTGQLDLIGHEPTYGSHPRNFAIDPSGNFLLVANQFSDNITIFRRNLNSGKLTKLSGEIVLDNPSSLQMRSYSIHSE